MILKAKHNFFIYPFFQWYAVWLIKRKFNKANIIGGFNDKNLPVLVIANHISWWDGFWAMYLNVKVLKRKFHFMMLEEQIRKFWFFNYTGGFSVNKKAKSVIETLNYTGKLLCGSKNMVLIFPQGEIQSMHLQTFQFEKGINHILRDKEDKIQILFMTNLVDYFSKPKPIINIYIQEYQSLQINLESVQNGYNKFYQQCIENQIGLKD
ncbi:MAG: lysophospholipid acyltransferase family protein [Tenuifilaceae bacterium]